MPTPPEPTLNPHVLTATDQTNVKLSPSLMSPWSLLWFQKVCGVYFAWPASELKYNKTELFGIRDLASSVLWQEQACPTDVCGSTCSTATIISMPCCLLSTPGQRRPRAPCTLVAKAIAACYPQSACMEAIGSFPARSSTVIAMESL